MDKYAINKFTQLLQAGKLSRPAFNNLKELGIARSDEVLTEGLEKGNTNLASILFKKILNKPSSRALDRSQDIINESKPFYTFTTEAIAKDEVPRNFIPIGTNGGKVVFTLGKNPVKGIISDNEFNVNRDKFRALFLRHELDEMSEMLKDPYKLKIRKDTGKGIGGHSSLRVLLNEYKNMIGMSDIVVRFMKAIRSLTTVAGTKKTELDLVEDVLHRGKKYKGLM